MHRYEAALACHLPARCIACVSMSVAKPCKGLESVAMQRCHFSQALRRDVSTLLDLWEAELSNVKTVSSVRGSQDTSTRFLKINRLLMSS